MIELELLYGTRMDCLKMLPGFGCKHFIHWFHLRFAGSHLGGCRDCFLNYEVSAGSVIIGANSVAMTKQQAERN